MSILTVIATALRSTQHWRPSGDQTDYQMAEERAQIILDAITSAYGNPAPDRLALARALVADMPNVVVAEVPEEAKGPPPHILESPITTAATTAWNACRTAILDQKEPKQ